MVSRNDSDPAESTTPDTTGQAPSSASDQPQESPSAPEAGEPAGQSAKKAAAADKRARKRTTRTTDGTAKRTLAAKKATKKTAKPSVAPAGDQSDDAAGSVATQAAAQDGTDLVLTPAVGRLTTGDAVAADETGPRETADQAATGDTGGETTGASDVARPARRRSRRATRAADTTAAATDAATNATAGAPADAGTDGAAMDPADAELALPDVEAGETPDIPPVSAEDILAGLHFPPPRDQRDRATDRPAAAGEGHAAAGEGHADADEGDADADEGDADEGDSGVAVPTFGLLFKAPEPAPDPRRRRRGQSAQPADEQPDPADDDTADDAGPRDAADVDDQGPDDSDDADDADRGDGGDDSSDDDDRGPRRRRRRGGKGRRRGPDSRDDDGSEEDSDQSEDDDSDEPSDSPDSRDSADSGEAGDSQGRKRTRRRRRSGSAATAGEDPPGTVTKVREPRRERDVATGIKGSTRLEAKRQRRREGREAGRRRTIITEAEFLARRESVERVMVVRQRDKLTQIGVLEDGVLVEHYISGPGSASAGSGQSMAGNVHLGRVQNVLPSMEAAFVDIGKGRNAVLYAGEVNWDAAGLEQHKARRIENALSSGQSVLVQVTKDPIGHKGARLTSQVSLPGRYLVYVPDGSMTGISRKLPDTERARLKSVLKEIVPDNAGVIVRTAAEGASEEELKADVDRLTREWDRIQSKAKSGNAPCLLHGEPDLTVRVVRDVFNEDFSQLVVAGDDAWATVREYVDDVAGDLAQRLTKWTGEQDVFDHFRVDEQLTKAMSRKVWLPSGGSLVIDRTEAMTVIDVNTGKFTGSGGNLEETVTKNNIEAAEEIVRQLRLRDIGGIIVIDFIDMVLEANRDLVVRRLMECLGRDRTKHQVAEVTSLGLVQMTRKRVGAGLIEVFSEPCEHCNGRGLIVHTEPVARSGDSASGGSGGRDSRDSRDSRESRRSRRGRGRETEPTLPPAPPTPTGPTPAQIAAAAYAAALQAGGGSSDAEPESAAQPAAQAEGVAQVVSEAVSDALRVTEQEAAGSSSDRSADDVSPAAQPPDASPDIFRGSDTLDAAARDGGAAEPAPAAAPPRGRRGSRRAASAPAASPPGAEGLVMTVDSETPGGGLDSDQAASGPASSGQAAAGDPAVGDQSVGDQPVGDQPVVDQSAGELAVGDLAAPDQAADGSAVEPVASASGAPPRRRRAARRAAGAPAGPPASASDHDQR